jgi:hypothetical protein
MDGLDLVQRSIASESLTVTDGQGGTVGLHRPGFRIAATDAARKRTSYFDPSGRLKVYGTTKIETENDEDEERTERRTSRDAAYADYDRELTGAWRGDRSPTNAHAERARPDRDGNGLGKRGGDHEDDEDEGRRVDSRSVTQMLQDHQHKMAGIYDQLDHELSEKWRQR